MRLGFLFNYDQIHQVAHSLPIALALARAGGHEIRVAVTNDALAAEVARLGGSGLRRHGVTVEHLRLRSRWRRALASAACSVVPAEKLLIYGDNLDFFRSLDMLVVSEKTSLAVRRFAGLETLPIVHTRHGAGDRAIGFDAASARFDLVLVPGKTVRRRLVDVAGVDPDRIRIVGYPKFDLEPRSAVPFPEPGPPVVLYSPHVSRICPHGTAWGPPSSTGSSATRASASSSRRTSCSSIGGPC